MARVWDRRKHAFPITSVSHDAPKKMSAFSYILPLIFLAAFMCAVLFFDKTCLEMAAGHELLSKLFTRCHE